MDPQREATIAEGVGQNIFGSSSTLIYAYLRATFWECRETEDTHEKSIFLLFHQNIPLGELIQGKVV